MLRPRYLALDSSHLSQWVHDKSGAKPSSRRLAFDFESWLEDNGFILLLTLHHIEELSCHGSASRVRDALHCLADLKCVAWVGEAGAGPGGVTTITRIEAKNVLAAPTADARSIRDASVPALLQCGTGRDLIGEDPNEWMLLRPLFQAHAEDARKLVALTHTNVVDISSRPVAELMKGTVRQGAELQRSLSLLRGSYAVDIQQRGDRHIESPDALAAEFVNQIERVGTKLPQTAEEFVLEGLALQGVCREDIQPASTIGEMLNLGLFRSQLKTLLADDGVSPEKIRQIGMTQMPSWLVQSAMRRFAPQPLHRDGSEVNDFYLACLAPYADVTFVDKRVLEGFHQALRKVPGFTDVVRRVERASRYDRIPGLLAT